MINQASLRIESVKPETFCDEDSDEDISSDSLDLVLTSRLYNKQNEPFATLTQYYTVSKGMLTVEDLIDYSLFDYPNFRTESRQNLRPHGKYRAALLHGMHQKL